MAATSPSAIDRRWRHGLPRRRRSRHSGSAENLAPLQQNIVYRIMTSLIIRNGTLIDGRSEAAARNTSIVVQGNKIVSVGPEGEAPRDAQLIDAKGKFIMPGLIDGHVHLSSHQGALPGVRFTSTPEYATLWTARVVGKILNAGVTGISVPGGKWFVDATVREAVAGGLIEGPRIFCAGRALTPYGGI